MQSGSIAAQATPMPPTKASTGRAQSILFKLLLLLSGVAMISTILATTSGDVVVQVLSQTELEPPNNDAADEQRRRSQRKRVAIVHEPYGYRSVKDDTGKPGFWRYLARATFYEYRLPRAILKVSQHREQLTLEESEELQFMGEMRKRPRGWAPSPDRNVFLDEPYRDKTVDRLFKKSHRKMNTGLVVGILSLLGLVFLRDKILLRSSSNKEKPTKLGNVGCSRLRIWISKNILLPLWNAVWKYPKILVMIPLIAPAILIGLAGAMPASAIVMLLNNERFCGHRCASSSLEASVVLEADACIEECRLGRGGKLAVVASCSWFLVLLLVVTVTAISLIVAKFPSVSSSLSRRSWWNAIFLPLAIRSDQVYHPLALPLSNEHKQ